MDQRELRELESLCIQDEAPWCTAACPVHVDVKSFISEVRAGKLASAYNVLAKAVVFPKIIGRICEHPCESRCKRSDIDDPVSVSGLERYCVTSAVLKPRSAVTVRKTRGKVAVVGAGLCGLSAAVELARKAYSAVVHESGPEPWGDLADVPTSLLPESVLAEELQFVAEQGVEMLFNVSCGSISDVIALKQDCDAVFVAVDIEGLRPNDNVTLATAVNGVFSGHPDEIKAGPISSVAQGKRAAVSIDRYLQKVSLHAGREKEGPFETRLYTNIAGVAKVAQVVPANAEKGYSSAEAAEEAARCLTCECMECVKACEYLKAFGSYPKKYLREIYNNEAIVMGQRQANNLINSCSLCGLCKEVCPNGLDMGAVVKRAREGMVMRGKMPPSPHDFPMRDLEFSNSRRFFLTKHAPDTESSSYLFFPGCQLCATMPRYVEMAYDYLRGKLGNVGLFLGCCGAPADWVGQTRAFHGVKDRILETLQALGDPTLVLACSSCSDIFSTHYPDIQVCSLWEIYDAHGVPQDHLLKVTEPIAIHDACTARHQVSQQDAVRSLLSKMGIEHVELDYGREKTTCCGFGGLMTFANPKVAKMAIDRRVGESVHPYLVYCAMCKDRFSSRAKHTYHMLDFIYGGIFPAGAPELTAGKNVGFSEKRENRARLKETLLDRLWGERMEGGVDPLQYDIKIEDDALCKMEERLILKEDVLKVIHNAETTGQKLRNSVTGRYLAYYRPTAVTYWVEYTVEGGQFRIHNVYSHRMEIGEG